MRSDLALSLIAGCLGACSLVESFDGYSDEWGRDASVASSGGVSGSSGWPGSGGSSAGTAGQAGIGGSASDATAECGAGLTSCSGSCVDPQSDREHCGGCGVRCAETLGPLATCSQGQCVCPPDTTKCTNLCTRLDSDPHNCGSCGSVVDPAEYCVAGQPQCRPRTSECKTWTTTGGFTVSCSGYAKCTDTKWDGSHCVDSGGAKSRCYWTAAEIGRCIDGECEYDGACPANRIECSSTLSNVKSCFDPLNDSNHCGACFAQCAPAETCAGGSCVSYAVVNSCDECAAGTKCCAAMPAPWAHDTICVSGPTCPA